MRRAAVVAISLALVLIAGLPPPAGAAQHLMRIEELSTGNPGNPDERFVDLQMFEANQNKVGGHAIRVYAADGSAQDCTMSSDVPNGTDDDHVLIATAPTVHGATADFVIPPILEGPGGAVCFGSFDCVSWGSFSGSTLSPAGTPIPGDFSTVAETMHRSKGGNGVLEAADDTDDSAADFSAAPASPQSNAGAQTPIACTAVAGSGGDAGDEQPTLEKLRAKTRGRFAIVAGKVEGVQAGARVKLILFANGSPLRKVAKAKANVSDAGRFKKRLRVPAGSTRCKVIVRFGGERLGKKKFRC